MQYTIKSGILYHSSSQKLLGKIKSSFIGPTKKIQTQDDEAFFETNILYLDENRSFAGDVRNRKYILTDGANETIAFAYPDYAQGENPDEEGWSLCRLPEVDHAKLNIKGEEYLLTMSNNQNYKLENKNGDSLLHMSHQGITGGWTLDTTSDFSPEILCAIFVFCRYMEQENEFLII